MRAFKSLALSLALAALPLAGAAQGAYPTKPIRLVMPFAAGGPSDVLARAVAKSLGEELGQPVVVDNRVGAGGSIGIDMVAKAAADGYTLGFAHTGSVEINPHLYTKHPYDPLKDLTPITPVVSYTNVLVINPAIPARTLGEFLAWVKANPREAHYASGGNGATNHLSGELLKSLTGVELRHVPYKGNAPAMVDVMSGNVSAMFDIPTTALPQIKAGKVRALAITGSKRSTYLPDVPTMKEAGVPGFEDAGSDLWFGLVGPANLPQPIVDKLYASTLQVLKKPELQEAIKGMAYEVWTVPPSDFRKWLRTDYAKWAKVVKLSGAKAD